MRKEILTVSILSLLLLATGTIAYITPKDSFDLHNYYDIYRANIINGTSINFTTYEDAEGNSITNLFDASDYPGDVWVNESGDSMTGNLTVDAKIGINTDSIPLDFVINQSADDSGLRIYGFDDRYDRYGDIYLDSSGYLVIESSVVTDWHPEGVHTMRMSSTYFRLYDNFEITFGDSSDYGIGYKSSDDTLRIVDGADIDSNARIVIENSGDVGIGIINPSVKLEVAGAINATDWSNFSCDNCIDSSDILDVDDEDIEADLNTYVDIAGDTMTGNLNMSNNRIYFDNDPNKPYIYFNEDVGLAGNTLDISPAIHVYNTTVASEFDGWLIATYLMASDYIKTNGDIFTTSNNDDLWLGSVTQATAEFKANSDGSLNISVGAFEINASGDVIEAHSLYLDDNEKIYFGDDQDVNMYWDGSSFVIEGA